MWSPKGYVGDACDDGTVQFFDRGGGYMKLRM